MDNVSVRPSYFIDLHRVPKFTQFDQRFGLRRAIQSPLFHLLRRETHEGEEWLVFDEEQLREYAAQDFEGFPGLGPGAAEGAG